MSTAPAPRREGALWPFAVAATVFVAAIVAAVLLTRGHHAKDVATACPKNFPTSKAEWVPAKAQTSDPGKALVPGGTPQRAVVCAYRHSSAATASPTSVALTGAKDLRGDPGAVVSALRAVRPAASTSITCDDVRIDTDGDAYLLAMSYDGKVVWVSMPGNHCEGSGNGTFTGATNLRPDAAQAYDNGIWPTDGSLTGQCDRAPDGGAPAQPPGDATRVTVCLVRADGRTHVYRYGNLDPATAGVFATAVRSGTRGATASATSDCLDTAGSRTRVQLEAPHRSDFVVLGSSACMVSSGNLIIRGRQAAEVYQSVVDLVDRT